MSPSQSPLTRLPAGLSFTSAAARPDLWQSVRYNLEAHGFKKISTWHSIALQKYYWRLGEEAEFAPLQTLVVDQTGDRVVGIGACVPFYWRELAQADGGGSSSSSKTTKDWAWTLPDAGWDAVLTLAFEQLQARRHRGEGQDSPGGEIEKQPAASAELPNAISALLVHVAPDYRTLGVADAIIGQFKAVARREAACSQAFVVPVKPTRKNDHVDVSMDEYITWAQDRPGVAVHDAAWMLGHDDASRDNDDVEGGGSAALPFDPWLRKHVVLGARVVKVAPDSFTVQGSAAEWKRRLGDAVQLDTVADADGREHLVGDKLDGVLYNGLPIRWDRGRGLGYHSEPDVWVIYV